MVAHGVILKRLVAHGPGIWRYLGYLRRRGIPFEYPDSLAAVAALRWRTK
ncbi:MAG: hypothetical protein FJ029_09145 [Actinobacteria bacterium]|nr:hypothetical protein [Actinomycetota bacterium]